VPCCARTCTACGAASASAWCPSSPAGARRPCRTTSTSTRPSRTHIWRTCTTTSTSPPWTRNWNPYWIARALLEPLLNLKGAIGTPSALTPLPFQLTRLWSAHAQRYDPSDIHEHDPHPTVAAHGVPALPLPPARSRTDHLSPGDAVGERESERAADRPSDQGLQHRRSVRALLPCRRVWRQGVSRDQGLRAGERGGRRSNASGDASHTAGFEGPCLNDWGT
jgi:hypothetical protein